MSQSRFRFLKFFLAAILVCSTLQCSHADDSLAPADCGCNPLAQAFTEQLKAVELSRYGAMTSNNLDALSTLLGDDLKYAHSTGVVQSKTEFLSDLREGKLRYRNISAQTQSVRMYGEIAIINGVGKFDLTAAGRDLSTMLVYTAVYFQRGEGLKRWELISWHSSPAPQ
jgi:hypothetical protein